MRKELQEIEFREYYPQKCLLPRFPRYLIFVPRQRLLESKEPNRPETTRLTQVNISSENLTTVTAREQHNTTEAQISKENNGGATSYYDLPPSSDRPCLDDLIEFKDMSRWRAEIFKSMYGWEGRAERSKDGSSSEVRELNKCEYYLARKRAMLGLDLPSKYDLLFAADCIIEELKTRIKELEG